MIFPHNISDKLISQFDVSVNIKGSCTCADQCDQVFITHRFQEEFCLYCGQAGHRVSNCPFKKSPPIKDKFQVSCTQYNDYSARPTITVSFLVSGSPVLRQVLMDSGADGNFMDSSLAKTLGLESTPLPKPLKATSFDGSALWEVSHQTALVMMLFGEDRIEEICFFEFTSPSQSVILEYPWLRQHNPL